MKNIFIYFILIFGIMISGCSLKAQDHSEHFHPGIANDSLLFDGAEEIHFNRNTFKENCNIKVTYVKGEVWGQRKDSIYVMDCSNEKIWLIKEVEASLKPTDVLVPKDHIKTGNNSSIEITFPDGSIMRLGPNTDFTFEDCNFTDAESK